MRRCEPHTQVPQCTQIRDATQTFHLRPIQGGVGAPRVRRSRTRCRPHLRTVNVPRPLLYPLPRLRGGFPRSLQTQSLRRSLSSDCPLPCRHRRPWPRCSVRRTSKGVVPLPNTESEVLYKLEIRTAFYQHAHFIPIVSVGKERRTLVGPW